MLKIFLNWYAKAVDLPAVAMQTTALVSMG